MLIIASRMQELKFSALMEVYGEGNAEEGALLYPNESRAEQLILAEQAFYQYLSQCFFAVEGAVYALWKLEDRYASALRLEPYGDGLLLEALETAPDLRRQGYATALIRGVLDWLSQHGPMKVYSHISRRNQSSIRTHLACGFRKILDHAVYADGSVLTSSDTYLFEVK
jgi:RimJ/RimL family protein N-acetyltransferase